MYIRFTTTYRDERGYTDTGVFHALGFLSRSDSTFDYDLEVIDQIRTWFNIHLERPARFDKHKSRKYSSRAICWYKCKAVRHISHMY